VGAKEVGGYKLRAIGSNWKGKERERRGIMIKRERVAVAGGYAQAGAHNRKKEEEEE